MSEKTASMIEQKSVFISRRKARQANCIGTKKIFSWLLMGINFEEQQPTLRTFKKFIKSIWQIHLELYISCHFPIYIWWWFLRCNYQAINDRLGTWEDIEEMRSETRLMFDFVCNHMSAESTWFQEYLNLNDTYKDFIDLPLDTDTSSVTRPRTSPLLTTFIDKTGKKTRMDDFSEDQVDLNFKIQKFYWKWSIFFVLLRKGASFIRLDAVGFYGKN